MGRKEKNSRNYMVHPIGAEYRASSKEVGSIMSKETQVLEMEQSIPSLSEKGMHVDGYINSYKNFERGETS